MGSGFTIQGLGFRVLGSGFTIQGLGARPLDINIAVTKGHVVFIRHNGQSNGKEDKQVNGGCDLWSA